MIYFLQSVDGGPVKIGFSADVEFRRQQLESSYGQPLALLAMLPGGRDEERKIHVRFAHLRFGRTEQFRPALELMMFIGCPLLVDANPDAVEAMGSVSETMRVDAESASLIRKAAALKEMSIMDFVREYLAPVANRVLLAEAKKLGKDQKPAD